VVVEYELTDAVAWIYLNRPHRLNAVVPELAAGLAAAFARAGQDNARVIVLAGRGRAKEGRGVRPGGGDGRRGRLRRADGGARGGA
jgi:1,4-dihydroxy-2-naphthoyl-CoA synthase